jgi:hypothetical protein
LHTGWYMEEVLGDFIGLDVFTKDKDPSITIYGDGKCFHVIKDKENLYK